jgi:DNA-binding NtrC family response regulator
MLPRFLPALADVGNTPLMPRGENAAILPTALVAGDAMTERVLIVDDDPVQRRLVENMVSRFGYEAVVAVGGDAAVAMLTKSDGARIDCVVLDLVMPDLDGLGVLAKMREAGVNLPVVVQTAHGSIDNVMSALRAGAVDFVVKPVGAERLQVSLRNALAARALACELTRLKRGRSGTLTFRHVVTRSSRMQALLRMAEKAAASTVPVLIEGEPGVGKELIARAIHGSSQRRTKPFVAANCGAIPDGLMETLLFGRENDSLTGATEHRPGKFVEASGGTLFLDAVDKLPPSAQVKLLRTVEMGVVEPVGTHRPVKVDVRLITATDRNLVSDSKAGHFREDLANRLNDFSIAVPPLRDRREDIPDLVRHYLGHFAAEEGKHARTISAAALNLLANYHWPGNIRQLENAVFRAVALTDGTEIGVNEFPQIAVQMSGAPAIELNAHQNLLSIAPSTTPSAEAVPPACRIAAEFAGSGVQSNGFAIAALPLLDACGQLRSLRDIEAEVIRFAIAHCRGQISDVARKLRIGRSTLYRKLDSLGLTRPDNPRQQDERGDKVTM